VSNFPFRAFFVAVFILAGCFGGCATTKPVVPPKDLSEGISLYEQGNFNAAIKKMTSSTEIWSADPTIQTEAFKYLAFSYCVTKKETLCRQQFERALKLIPTFDLAPNEKGHPLWGPVFAQAKRLQQQNQGGAEKVN
jgi:hypothetical protein